MLLAWVYLLPSFLTPLASTCLTVFCQVAVYHGPERNRSRAWLAQQDVVITTYATLAGDVGLRGGGGLFGQQWLRVVLDEAHTIRNSETQQAKVRSNILRKFCNADSCD
jgi:SNF2 family DNA or RNA helicase